MTTRKYNPGFLTDDELVASFRVRTHEFDSTVEMLRECTGTANAHRLVIGPRGSGKTCLLLRVVAELRRAADLSSRFFPVVFAEESYMVATVGEFWLEALARLAEQAPRPVEREALRRSWDDLRAVGDDRALGERCLGAVLDFADRQDKRIVLVVENLNAMFADMTDAEEAGWRLRKTLQTEPRILVLASATSRFDEMDNPDRALYDLFRVVRLQPLDDDECGTLWESVSRHGRAPGTVRALRILTGGSPRLLAVLARFGGGLSFRDLMGALLELIDDHTEYFRGHLEALPAQERRVYLALADLWRPATTREVALRARLDTSKCSAQLARLVDRGVVEVAGGGPRRKEYYVTERLYNIYYLIRRASGPAPVVEALVRFMASYYAPGELKTAVAGIARESTAVEETMRPLLRSAFALLAAEPVLEGQEDELLPLAPNDFMLAALEAITEREEIDLHAYRDAGDALKKASRLAGDGRLEEALAVCDAAARAIQDSESTVRVRAMAPVLVQRAGILLRLDRPTEALAAYDDALGRFVRDDSPGGQGYVAIAGLGKGKALEALDRGEEALATYDEVVDRLGEVVPPEVAAFVAALLLCRVSVLASLGRPDKALAACDEFVGRFDGHDARFDLGVASALRGKGSALKALNRDEEALAAYGEAVRRFVDSGDAAGAAEIYEALLGKATAQMSVDREAAFSIMDELLCLFEASSGPEFALVVAVGLFAKASMLASLDRLTEAVNVGNSVVQRFGASEDPKLQFAAASALYRNGAVFSAMNRPGEAVDAWDEVLRRLETEDAPNAAELFAKSLVAKGTALLWLDRTSEAFDAWDDVVRRFGASDVPALRRQADQALLRKALEELEQKRDDEAFATASLVLEIPGRATPEDRWEGHTLRAIAARRKADPKACERDIAALLGVLSEMDALPGGMAKTLKWAIWALGNERLLELIAASPSADLLRPFAVALERELGIESRVAREVEEVAEDIRQDLGKEVEDPLPPRSRQGAAKEPPR